ncbi:hypothetical protein F4677DRAFT_286591 [Hypoxylon crocopeplum]|nr:hypothetical protein F4677DRAFT_286591 [Hypoxylon crocopeplum]
MATPVEDSFLAFSSTDASVELLEDQPKTNDGPRLLTRAHDVSKRKFSLSIDTSFSAKNPGVIGHDLRSAVADALGVDASELPQPFHGPMRFHDDSSSPAHSSSSISQRFLDEVRLSRRGSASSVSVYSPAVDIAAWRRSMGESIEKRLTVAVAEVLGLDSSSLPLDESFVDLGGNHRKARELRANCIDAGLAIKTKDIMNCRTIAELQTCVTPLTPSLRSENKIPPTIVSPLDLRSPQISLDGFQRRSSESHRPPVIPPKAAARLCRAPSQIKPGPSRIRCIQVEQVLSLHTDVSRASVLKPRAGPFEGQIVAFIALASYAVDASPDDCEVRLHGANCAGQLLGIRDAVESQVPPGLVPSVWVVLEKMPVDEAGKDNRRKLQTWIQNANDELQRQILSVGSEEDLKQPASAIERRLQKTASRVLRIEQTGISMDMSFAKLGGNECAATRFVAKCKSRGISLDTEDVMQATLLNQLAALATSTESHGRNPSEAAAEAFELSPMQRLYFHTRMGNGSSRREAGHGEYRFNQSILFRLKRNVGVEDIHAAVEAAVSRHSTLRCRFRLNGSSWCQSIEPEVSSSYHFAHHSVRTNAEVEEVMKAAQATIDIEAGPVFVAHHFHTHDNQQMLYMVAHHLVVDLRSWRVIADDMDGLLTSGYFTSGQSLSFKEWTLCHRRHVRRKESFGTIPFDIPSGYARYWGIDEASNTYGNTTATSFSLSADVTSALDASCRTSKTEPAAIFMAALVLSFVQTFRDRPVPILWNQEHERNSLDAEHRVSETVGWLTSLCPFAIDASPTDDIVTVLSRVNDSRRNIAGGSTRYFTANLIDATSALSFASSHCPLELIFTYAGTLQNIRSQNGLLEQLPVPDRTLDSGTSDIGRHVGRVAVFEVSISVDQGETKFKILYHRNSNHQEQIHSWLRNYENSLRQAATRLQYESPGLSLSDIPHMDITDEGLGRLNWEILPRLNLNAANIEAVYPVTAIQQNILTNQSLIPGSSNVQMVYDLDTPDGPVDISRICAAWLQITEKHSALRTVFSQSVSKSGLYDQIILRSHSPSMLFLESDSVEDAMMSIHNLPPLPLNEGVPWHKLIVCRVAGKTFLKLEASQAICDIASMTILFREIEQAYFYNQVPSAPEVPYHEYMQCLKTTACSIDFWREHLRGVQPCHFPMLVSERAVLSEWETTSIDLKVSCESLRTFAHDYKISISTVLRAAWALLLRTYIGSDNVCFGFRISGRDIPVEGLSDAVGSFSTILTSRLAIPSGESIAQLLLDAEEEGQRVLHHQHVPVSRIEHELKIKGEHLFNTCLSFGYEYVCDDISRNTRCRHVRTEQASECDVNTDVYFHGGNVTVDIGYRALTSDQATSIASAFGRAIEGILDAPTGTVKEADLFSMRDHKQILAWNSMPQVDVSKAHIHQLIANQASLNPDIEAICAWDGDLSYDDLHKSSVVLAKHLLATGLKPQMPVPVIVDKSRWAVVAMLAVLHAGAILVPVDTEFTSMYASIIKAVSADFVLVSDHVRKQVDNLARKVIIVNGKTVAAMSAQTVDITLPQSAPYHIACILFSCGPSKTPKGISYSHGALATACAGQGSTLLINPSSRVMQLSSYSVDIALSETFTTLVNGGCVCVPSASERVAGFSEAAIRMRVNWTVLTPTLSRKLDPESLPNLAIVCFRTRHLDSDVYAPWLGKAKVLLVYGSAEACPLGLSATELSQSGVSQCFGSPFCGNFWVVSPEDNNRLMPVGAVGELVIGGPTLASGFDINDPDVKAWVGKSAARAKSLLEKSGSRLLKTGHLVRYREEGKIEFVSDDGEETEINGKRFRPSDVEPKLRQCLGRGVDVVVETIAFNDPNSAPILAAFIELGESLFQGSEDLSRLSRITRERLYLSKKMADMVLRETLPSYQVPSAYIPVKRMPLTPTLEVNRLELQHMIAGFSRKRLIGLAEVANPQEIQNTSFKPLPLTKVELQMRAIWAQVLGTKEDAIIASDGFLGLGGNVVLAHDLIIECRERGIAISIIDVLRDVSLSELCRGVVTTEVPLIIIQEESRGARPSPSNGSLVDEGIAPRLGSDRSLIEDVAEASSLQTTFVESGTLQSRGNINHFMIKITGSLDWQRLENACFMLTKAHPTLRTAFVSHGRQLYQTVLRSYRPEFLRYQCQSWRIGNLAAKLIKREQAIPVDFRRPITKFSYLDAGKSSMLVMRLSRAQYDDLSISLLIRDLSRFYSRPGRVVRRPGFCEVVKSAQSTQSNGAGEYWRTLLEGATMTQVVSQPSPASVNMTLRTFHRQIPTGSLQNLGIAFETILKGAWSIVLSNLSGTDDVVFGQLVERKNLSLPSGHTASDIVGPTGNIVPVRTRLPDIPIPPYEYFRRIQSQHVASMPHETIETSDIVQKCTSWPSWTRFSTVVYHQNQGEDTRMINFTIGDASCKLNCIESNQQDSDMFVKSVMSGSTNVDVSITFCEKRMDISFADEVLNMLSSIISLLASTFVMEPIMLRGLNDNYSTSRIPLPAPRRELGVPSTVESVDPDQARAVHTMISAAWDTILEAHSLKVPDIRSVPFYEIWGAVVPAAELARYYTENVPATPGVGRTTFTMEEIIDHPTMMQQYELIIAKQQIPQLKHSKSLILISTPSVWGKNIRRLPRVSGTPNAAPSSYPVRRNHKSIGSSGSSSMESMTMGESQSDDEDELNVEAILSSPGSPGSPGLKTGAKGGDVKATTKKGASLLGRMIPAISG